MIFSFEFGSGWYILFSAFFISWLSLMFFRGIQVAKKEVRHQITFGVSCFFVCVLMEIFAISQNLWNYSPANWPVILWPTYFVAMLFGYQLMRLVGEKACGNSMKPY
jgi:hypothetical protein